MAAAIDVRCSLGPIAPVARLLLSVARPDDAAASMVSGVARTMNNEPSPVTDLSRLIDAPLQRLLVKPVANGEKNRQLAKSPNIAP